MSTDKTTLRAQWENDATLRAEFDHDYEGFAAFRAAEASGRVRVLRGSRRSKIAPASPDDPAFARKIIQAWKADPGLRAEFDHDIEAFEEYARNEDHVRILGD